MTMRLPARTQRDSLKIGELAEELGITPRTLRLYEELGLIAPKRTAGGTRLYGGKDAKRLAVVLGLARLGMDLGKIQRLAGAREQCGSGREAAARIAPLLDELRAWTESTAVALDSLRGDLERTEDLVRRCSDCPNRPNRKDCPECPMERGLESAHLARLIWDPDSP